MGGKRLTEDQRAEVVQLLSAGATQDSVAEKLGISQSQVSYTQKKHALNGAKSFGQKEDDASLRIIPEEVAMAAARAAADKMYEHVIALLRRKK